MNKCIKSTFLTVSVTFLLSSAIQCSFGGSGNKFGGWSGLDFGSAFSATASAFQSAQQTQRNFNSGVLPAFISGGAAAGAPAHVSGGDVNKHWLPEPNFDDSSEVPSAPAPAPANDQPQAPWCGPLPEPSFDLFSIFRSKK